MCIPFTCNCRANARKSTVLCIIPLLIVNCRLHYETVLFHTRSSSSHIKGIISIGHLYFKRYPCHTTRHADPHRAIRTVEGSKVEVNHACRTKRLDCFRNRQPVYPCTASIGLDPFSGQYHAGSLERFLPAPGRPRAVVRFTSLAPLNSREDFHLQDCAHAGRTKKAAFRPLFFEQVSPITPVPPHGREEFHVYTFYMQLPCQRPKINVSLHSTFTYHELPAPF
jgi:hypothetical protein